MHESTKSLLKQGLSEYVSKIRPFLEQHQEFYLVWKRNGEGGWQGANVLRTDLRAVLRASENMINETGLPFAESFLNQYPEFRGLAGFQRYGSCNFGADPLQIFRATLGAIWNRFGRLNLDETEINTAVNEFEAFIDRPEVPIRVHSILLNFRSPCDSFELANGMRIRRMSEEELSEEFGGRSVLESSRNPFFSIHEFRIEFDTIEPKLFENTNVAPLTDDAKDRFEKAILCLRTFKSGRVGFDRSCPTPIGICPFMMGTHHFADSRAPFGSYSIEEHEKQSLESHSRMIFELREPAMEMACSRLSDSENRFNPRDQLVDAVIGMEALLLAGLRGEDRRGELKFRFSLNYSATFDTPESKLLAFRTAKDLYDIRSIVAHGSSIDDETFRLGDKKKVGIKDAARTASDELRRLVRHFLPAASTAPYKKHDFWERSYFGLSEEP